MALSSNINIIDYLINYENYDVNEIGRMHENALYGAVMSNDVKVVKYLLDKGIDTKLKNQNDETAYDVAVRLGIVKKEIIELLS